MTYPTVTRWYKRFKSGDLSLDDHELEGRPEKCLDNDLQALLDKNSCRTQQELAEVLEVDRTTIARHLKAMGKIASGKMGSTQAKRNKQKTVAAERYWQQLNHLSKVLDEKRPFTGHGLRPVKLLHDNARPHIAKTVYQTLMSLRWEVLRHPAYSPDLARPDYHLFRSMNNALQGVHFQTFEEVQKWVDNFFASKSQEFFREGIHELPIRWQKVLDNNGEYFDD